VYILSILKFYVRYLLNILQPYYKFIQANFIILLKMIINEIYNNNNNKLPYKKYIFNINFGYNFKYIFYYTIMMMMMMI
jgi:hypothetical protein